MFLSELKKNTSVEGTCSKVQLKQGFPVTFFRLETDKVKNLQYVRGLIVGPFFVSAKLIALAVFLTYSLGGGQMSPVIVFMTLALYQAVRLSTTLFVPFAITFMMETKVTLDRAQVSI